MESVDFLPLPAIEINYSLFKYNIIQKYKDKKEIFIHKNKKYMEKIFNKYKRFMYIVTIYIIL